MQGGSPTCCLNFFPLNEATGPADPMIHLGFAVDDLNVALKSVEAAGGRTVRPPQHTDWGYRAVVRDPDGRGVELYQT
jgi:predicted enzyme related to lactoylglutathione lyase